MIPLWIKLAYTLMVLVIVPIYWRNYGPGNFLWFSDIALLAMVLAVWLEDPWIVSMMAVGVLVPELAWNLAYFYRLLTRRTLSWIGGLTAYMFEAQRPRWLRALSLFHVPLPALVLWLLVRWGYDERAILAQTVLAWVVLALCYRLTPRAENVNWVFGVGPACNTYGMPLWKYRVVQAVVLPVGVFLPTHLALVFLIGPVR